MTLPGIQSVILSFEVVKYVYHFEKRIRCLGFLITENLAK